jgi:hypothetical protein
MQRRTSTSKVSPSTSGGGTSTLARLSAPVPRHGSVVVEDRAVLPPQALALLHQEVPPVPLTLMSLVDVFRLRSGLPVDEIPCPQRRRHIASEAEVSGGDGGSLRTSWPDGR